MKIEAGYLARLAAEQHADRVALSYQGTDVTFEALNERANRIGSAFRSLGVERGERVGVLTYNRPEVVEAWLGFEKHAIVRTVLHSHFDMDAHTASLDHVGAIAVLFDTRFSAKVDEQRRELQTVRHFVGMGPDCPDWAISYEDLLASGDGKDPYLDVDEDDPCFLQLTSGTTGRPKAWTKSYRSWLAVVDQNLHHLDTFGAAGAVSSDDVNMHFHAIQWASGFQTLYPYIVRGARTVLVDDEMFDPDSLIDTMVDQRVTGTLAPGPLLTPLLDAVEKRGAIDHSMRRMVIFFATPELLTRTTQVLGPVWCHGFGSTEQGAVTTRLLPEEIAESPNRAASVGRVASGLIEIAIMDREGNRLPAGEVGEIVVRSPMSVGYYWGLPEKTRASFFDGDWFRPDDIGYLDGDGFLFYADRAGDAIGLATGVVYPHRVESAILCHPAVGNCGVVGVDQADEILVVAAIQLKHGWEAGDDLAAEILKEASLQLEEREHPRGLVFIDELPTVLGGAKVQRSALRQMLQDRA